MMTNGAVSDMAWSQCGAVVHSVWFCSPPLKSTLLLAQTGVCLCVDGSCDAHFKALVTHLSREVKSKRRPPFPVPIPRVRLWFVDEGGSRSGDERRIQTHGCDHWGIKLRTVFFL